MKSTWILKEFRGNRLLSQKDAAKLLNISRQTYNSLENNPLKYDFILIFELLKKLEISEEEKDEFFNALRQDYMSYINEK